MFNLPRTKKINMKSLQLIAIVLLTSITLSLTMQNASLCHGWQHDQTY